MNHYQIIQSIAVTEKSAHLTEGGKYTFIVHTSANKGQIKRAVEALFETEVASVNVMNRLGKSRRTRYGSGKRADTKKAIVTLKADQEALELF